MNRFLEKDLYVKIFAAFLAIILWLYVMNEQSPRIQRTFVVSLQYKSLSSDLAIQKAPEKVRVIVSGLKDNVLALEDKDIRAFVDLGGVSEGQYSLPVKIENPETIKVDELVPDQATISLEAVVSKTVAVTPQIKGDILKRDAIAATSVQVKEVLVRGARSKIARVQSALAVVHLSGMGGNLQTQGKIVPIDRWGKIVNGVETDPESTQVSINTQPAKQVSVKPLLQGNPASGYIIEKVMITPVSIRIIGSSDRLDQINYLSTEPIDITGINRDLEKEVFVSLPKDIRTMENPRVKVLVVVSQPQSNRTFSQIPVVVEGAPPGWQAKIDPEKVDLVVAGRKNDLDKVKPGDLKAIVNTNGKEGEILTTPQVILPEGLILEKITPQQIMLNVKKSS